MHPIFLKLGPITLYSYGLMVAIGFITATILASRTAKIFGVPPDNISTLSLAILISGVIGARLLYVLLNLKDFLSSPFEIFMVSHGGLVFYGGAISALFSGLVYLKIVKLPIWDIADIISPYIALGHSIGRIGCFLNGCCFGKPTISFFGIMFGDGIVRHPTQIYSSVFLVFLYMFLRTSLQFRQFKGQIFFSYLIFYPAGRFFIEFLRGDNPIVVFNFTFSQIISLGIFIFGVGAYWFGYKWNKRR
ncbi:MAG: prolipoprotein diacylglyceryl transferase [Candidatus Omnitrophica bacterium]|nr:prolipoprotein diacylglyceryl transferase [Candidatus Omnitrophota bacterium]